MNIQFLVLHCLHDVHLTEQKMSLIIIEVKISKFLKELETKITSYEKKKKKEMIPLTYKTNKSQKKSKCFLSM